MVNHKNIIMTGFMATGKTTVGKKIAEKTGREFIDTDILIEKRNGLPVAEIFNKYGEVAFRSMEKDIAEELSEKKNLVIATGGGFFLCESNITILNKLGEIFTLTASVKELKKRIETDTLVHRPLLTTNNGDIKSKITQLLNSRISLYNKFIQIKTDGYSPEIIADTIISCFTNKK